MAFRAGAWAALVVLAGAMAGCNAPSDDGSSPLQGAPDLAAARAVAEQWDPKAGLSSLIGVETVQPSNRPAGMSDDFYAPMFRVPDPKVGDGLATAWLAVHSTSDHEGKRLEVLLDAGGDVLGQREVQGAAQPLLGPGLGIITPGLAQQLDDLHAGWHAGNEEGGTLVWSLQAQGDPVWALQGAIDSQGAARSYLFDAHTAALLSTVEGLEFVAKEEGSGSRSVSPLQPPQPTQFLLLLVNHTSLGVKITQTSSIGGFSAGLVDPSGAEHGFVEGQVTVQPALKGEWRIWIQAEPALGVEVDFEWCAPGNVPTEACE